MLSVVLEWSGKDLPQNTQNGLRPSQNTQKVLRRKGLGFQCIQCAAGGGFSVFSDKISSTAQGILDARARDPDASLADLYDPLTMPPDLRAAHAANDRAVLAASGLAPATPEPEIVAHLFRLYAEKAKP